MTLFDAIGGVAIAVVGNSLIRKIPAIKRMEDRVVAKLAAKIKEAQQKGHEIRTANKAEEDPA